MNQVIIEEGSGLPGVDSQIVRGVKKWRFRPAWQKDSPDYQWGVAKVRIQSIPIPMMAVPDTSGAVPSSAWDS